ncbi:16S rRNA processing protein RimM [Pseudooceanicola batsensis HTCC2597]|uniref:Ribosome maturation factor RimM n=1 Tax=Pseudooceanicola batsensis (strain ATCC BAA-863 / DSM 15984 / KCTC 12145 / HTCC2597) TaxID=252305 RepID=A3TY66_PSEBH|nr:ribosome maturation factor RimM [Pseudooceanicola batsensis]EAQ03100.1 16S rRNA processing protein RimM [Pseudooceanicola batsensis HTCC2597]
MTETVCVGAIAGSYGVRGEVRLKSFCADPEAIAEYGPLTGDNGASYSVTLTRPIKNGFAARLGGVATKEEADALKGVQLFAPRDRLPATEEDEFYHADLIGLRVVDTGGTEIGTIRAVMDHGAGDLLEIKGPGLKNTVLLPFTRACVPTVDLAGGKVVADPPEGLF